MATAVSAGLTISSGGRVSFSHGLGVVPTYLDYYLECVTAEQGWAVGTIIRPSQFNPGSGPSGAVLFADATTASAQLASTGVGVFRAVQNSGSFLPINLTNSFWKLHIVAVSATVFTSADQTISSAGSATLAHGLGTIPGGVHFGLKCVTAENGYSVGDVIWSGGFTGGASAQGVVCKLTTTSLIYKYVSNGTSVFKALNKSTGALVTLTNANWRLVIKAQAGGTINTVGISQGGSIANTTWPAANSTMTSDYTCVTAEFGYVVNDAITLGWFVSPSVNSGEAVARSANSGRFGSGVATSPTALIRWDTATIASMTPLNWRLNVWSATP